MHHLGAKTIETERLILRNFKECDAEAAFRNWMGDARVAEFLRWTPHTSVEESKNTLRSWISEYNDPAFYLWAIVPKVLDEPIGSISVVGMKERTETLHIGYCIGYDFWGKGYMTEAFSGLIPYFFEKIGAGRIESQHDPNNPGSGRVMQKCGLTYEGTLRRADWSNQGIVDACMYALLREDYFARK